MRRYLLRSLIYIPLFFLMANACAGQTSADADRETSRELAQQIKELQEKVALLEKNQAPAQLQPVAIESSQPTQQERSELEAHNFRGIRWHGFGEVNYKVLDQK